MKRLVIGILAHVDSGKTTLSEALLYRAGEINKLGRVDHRDSFFDTDTIERDRGITIFSKMAPLHFDDCEFTLLDTPGHADFSAEAERVLCVLDYAVLLISASEGVQSHTKTLWDMLKRYNVPTFIFVNKTDISGVDKEKLYDSIKKELSDSCIDFSDEESMYENAATVSEEMLECYLESGRIEKSALISAIAERKLFPILFGSALKMQGVDEFTTLLREYTEEKKYQSEFGAKVFKIGEDPQKKRLTYMKITGGELKTRDLLETGEEGEKVTELRIYSGAKYKSVPSVSAGGVAVAVGLINTLPGDGIGIEKVSEPLMSEAVFSYAVKLPEGTDMTWALSCFKRFEEEENSLKVSWNERTKQINVALMGQVQLEVLSRVMKERFSLDAQFESGNIIYKETIKDSVEGVGHYEPLRHYSEVHLLLEEGKRGSGLVFRSKCSEDLLDKNWQRLIMTHLREKTHIGVLTGSAITDMKITLVSGRAHVKHTEGGDFRQATYRALRQGLMQAKSVLLEPYFKFAITLPTENIGRAMSDLENMGAEISLPETDGDFSVLSGYAPAAAMQNYQADITAYTHGMGKISINFSGYRECKNSDEVIKSIGYDAEADIENTADSVFCSHGSGFLVKWNEVKNYMHLEGIEDKTVEAAPPVSVRSRARENADPEELIKIFEQTYGKIKRKTFKPMQNEVEQKEYKMKENAKTESFLLIDGYNIIFAWEDYKKIANENLETARELLIERVCNYQAMKNTNVILVFDAYKVKSRHEEVEKIHGISVVYTKEAETADAYIEKTTKKLCKKGRVRVATSDGLIQLIIFGNGAYRMSAREFLQEIERTEEEIREYLKEE